MTKLLNLSWLIPLLPFATALTVALLLASFNRTMNRLTKPVSFLLISSLASSAILGFCLFFLHVNGHLSSWNIDLFGVSLLAELYIDDISSITSAVVSLIVLVIMTYSYFTLERKKGYVAYFSLLGFASASILSFVFSGNLFHSVIGF